jgi:hypothetical protein
VVIDMDTSPPEIRLWLEITNDSRFDLMLDRLLLTVKSAGLNILAFDRGIFERVKVPKNRTTENLCYFAYIDVELAERIGQQATFVQNLNQWQIRIMVQANGFFHSRWVGWITTGQRTVFLHDAFPIAGAPPKRTVPVLAEDQRKAEHKDAVRQAILRLATGNQLCDGQLRFPGRSGLPNAHDPTGD